MIYFGNHLTALAVIKQQNYIGPAGNAVLLPLVVQDIFQISPLRGASSWTL